jgi:hypothetical protein
LRQPDRGEKLGMLRKAMWTGLYAGFGAASTVVARRLATKVWRVATGEEPPTKR